MATATSALADVQVEVHDKLHDAAATPSKHGVSLTNTVPLVILAEIASFLGSFQDLLALSSVCKPFAAATLACRHKSASVEARLQHWDGATRVLQDRLQPCDLTIAASNVRDEHLEALATNLRSLVVARCFNVSGKFVRYCVCDSHSLLSIGSYSHTLLMPYQDTASAHEPRNSSSHPLDDAASCHVDAALYQPALPGTHQLRPD